MLSLNTHSHVLHKRRPRSAARRWRSSELHSACPPKARSSVTSEHSKRLSRRARCRFNGCLRGGSRYGEGKLAQCALRSRKVARAMRGRYLLALSCSAVGNCDATCENALDGGSASPVSLQGTPPGPHPGAQKLGHNLISSCCPKKSQESAPTSEVLIDAPRKGPRQGRDPL